MGTPQEFGKPGKGFKQVKTVSLRLPDSAGADCVHKVTVYITTAGTPSFAIAVPAEYANAWLHHKDAETKMGFHERIYVKDGVVSAESFDEVVKRLEVIAGNFQRHISNLSMKKVIRLQLTMKADGISHSPPSFDQSAILIGIRSGIYWEVNGSLYEERRHRDTTSSGAPSFNDLCPANISAKSGVVIAFTDEAWRTVCEVESTLARAAKMLFALTKPEDAQALLCGGLPALLASVNLITAPEAVA